MHVEGTEVQLDEEETKSELGKAFIRSVEKAELVTQLLSWEAEGTKEVLMVAKDEQPTLYVLLNISAGGSKVNGMAVLAGGRWYDPFHLTQGDTKMMLAGILMKAAENKNKKKEDNGPRREEYLPTEGLETVELTEIEIKI